LRWNADQHEGASKRITAQKNIHASGMFHVKQTRAARLIDALILFTILIKVTLNVLPDNMCGRIDAKMSLAENIGIQRQECFH
jgi:hypothetical protein